MNGGEIINNSSMYGGGIFVTGIQTQEWKANVQLNGGIIANNEATRQGGGIYVVRGQEVHLRNVVISENEASKLGGGIWTCSTGKLQIYITNGGAVFDNSANVGNTASAGDDLAFVKHEDSTTDFFLSQRVLGAGKIDYYLDGGIYTEELGTEGTDGSGQYYLGVADNSPRFNSYNPGEPISDVELNESSYALKSVLSDTAKLLASEKASLFITGNKADRGAGIGSNGNVIIGDVPNPDEGINEYSLSVRKEWDISVPEYMKEDIKVALVSDGHELDTIVLNEENEWTGEFTGLPFGNYTVKEVTIPDNMVSNISKTSLDSENYTYEVVITNKLNLIEIPVKKVWEDDDNRDGIRPDVIKVYVYADSQKIDELNITSKDNWSTVIKNLPATKNGVAINYTIREKDIDGYSSVITGNMVDGFIIKNSRIVQSDENHPENDSNEVFTATDVVYQLVNTKDK